MRITIIGLGLIGGSFGLALRKAGYRDLIGWDSNKTNREQAKERNTDLQLAKSLDAAVLEADLIVLAIPVTGIKELISKILDSMKSTCTLVDFGSTKSSISNLVKDHPRRIQFLAAHPIAGTEYSGPNSALPDLFEEKVMILCDSELSDQSIVKNFEHLCQKLKMSVVHLSSEDHDLQLGYVSHLSHAVSFALSKSVLKAEKSDSDLLNLAGSGFQSTVRLAKSSPEMWAPIFLNNKGNVLDALHRFSKELQRLIELIKEENGDEIISFLQSAREIRRILK